MSPERGELPEGYEKHTKEVVIRGGKTVEVSYPVRKEMPPLKPTR